MADVKRPQSQQQRSQSTVMPDMTLDKKQLRESDRVISKFWKDTRKHVLDYDKSLKNLSSSYKKAFAERDFKKMRQMLEGITDTKRLQGLEKQLERNAKGQERLNKALMNAAAAGDQQRVQRLTEILGKQTFKAAELGNEYVELQKKYGLYTKSLTTKAIDATTDALKSKWAELSSGATVIATSIAAFKAWRDAVHTTGDAFLKAGIPMENFTDNASFLGVKFTGYAAAMKNFNDKLVDARAVALKYGLTADEGAASFTTYYNAIYKAGQSVSDMAERSKDLTEKTVLLSKSMGTDLGETTQFVAEQFDKFGTDAQVTIDAMSRIRDEAEGVNKIFGANAVKIGDVARQTLKLGHETEAYSFNTRELSALLVKQTEYYLKLGYSREQAAKKAEGAVKAQLADNASDLFKYNTTQSLIGKLQGKTVEQQKKALTDYGITNEKTQARILRVMKSGMNPLAQSAEIFKEIQGSAGATGDYFKEIEKYKRNPQLLENLLGLSPQEARDLAIKSGEASDAYSKVMNGNNKDLKATLEKTVQEQYGGNANAFKKALADNPALADISAAIDKGDAESDAVVKKAIMSVGKDTEIADLERKRADAVQALAVANTDDAKKKAQDAINSSDDELKKLGVDLKATPAKVQEQLNMQSKLSGDYIASKLEELFGSFVGKAIIAFGAMAAFGIGQIMQTNYLRQIKNQLEKGGGPGGKNGPVDELLEKGKGKLTEKLTAYAEKKLGIKIPDAVKEAAGLGGKEAGAAGEAANVAGKEIGTIGKFAKGLKGFGKVAGILGTVATVAVSGKEAYDALKDDKKTKAEKSEAVGQVAGEAAGGWAGAEAGAAGGALAGAAIGSVVPVLGTAIGAAVGGLVGGGLGAYGGSKGGGYLGKKAGHWFGSGKETEKQPTMVSGDDLKALQETQPMPVAPGYGVAANQVDQAVAAAQTTAPGSSGGPDQRTGEITGQRANGDVIITLKGGQNYISSLNAQAAASR